MTTQVRPLTKELRDNLSFFDHMVFEENPDRAMLLLRLPLHRRCGSPAREMSRAAVKEPSEGGLTGCTSFFGGNAGGLATRTTGPTTQRLLKDYDYVTIRYHGSGSIWASIHPDHRRQGIAQPPGTDE